MVSPKKIAGTSDEAVRKATGKGWSQWLALLDRKKATQMSHREIGQFLREKYYLFFPVNFFPSRQASV